MGKIFYITGKSATGKDHIYEELISEKKPELIPIVMYTTRPMRAGEEEGREYHFVDKARLVAFREAGKVIEERTYHTVHGDWHYFTADDGQIDLDRGNYLAIGTLESYNGVRAFFGDGVMVPLYIESDADVRLLRSISREQKEEKPKYAEVCRRFLADEADYEEEKILAAGIAKRFSNNGEFADCLREVKEYVREVCG